MSSAIFFWGGGFFFHFDLTLIIFVEISEYLANFYRDSLCSGKDTAWTDLVEYFTAGGFTGRTGQSSIHETEGFKN